MLYLKINIKISSTLLLLKELIVCNKVNYMLYKIILDKEPELCAIFSLSSGMNFKNTQKYEIINLI